MAYEKDIMIESNFAVRKCWMRSISSLYKPWSHTRTLWAQNLSQDLPCPGAAGGFSPFLRQVTNESVVWVRAEVPKVPWSRSMLPRGVLPGALSSLGIWKQAGTYCAFGFSRPSGWRKLIKHDKHINGFPIFCIYQRLCGAIAKLPPSQGLSSRSMIVKQQSGRWPAPWQQGCRDVGVLLWTEHGEFWKISGELLWYMECTNGVQAEVHMLRQDLWEAGTLEQGSCMSEI